MKNQIAILVSGALIAAAIVYTNRWEFLEAGGDIYRADRLSGWITKCDPVRRDQYVPGSPIPCKLP